MSTPLPIEVQQRMVKLLRARDVQRLTALVAEHGTGGEASRPPMLAMAALVGDRACLELFLAQEPSQKEVSVAIFLGSRTCPVAEPPCPSPPFTAIAAFGGCFVDPVPC